VRPDPRDRSRGASKNAPAGGGTYGDLDADYELLGELGRGGTAVVYRARDRRLGREVALKVVRVPPALAAGGDEALTRLAREARTIARLEHPHIVRVNAVRELRDGLALEMPCIAGRTLKQVIAEEGPLPPARAAAILADVAAALAFAHANGVVHRDVKPENVFIETATGKALLADFGVARSHEADARLTQTGVTLGTPAYMSPEQIEGRDVDGRSDVYSLGLVGWEMLTGRRPWEGEGLFAVLQRQQRDELPPVEAVRPPDLAPVPPTLLYVVERMMQKRPAARWADAGAVAAQLAHPVLPADFAQWKRAHARRVAAERGAPPGVAARGASLVGAALTTMRLRRDDAPSADPATDAGAETAPSWMRDADRRRRTRPLVVGGTVVLLAGAALALGVRARDRADAAVADRPSVVADGERRVPVPAVAVPPADSAREPVDSAREFAAASAVAPAGAPRDTVSAPTAASAAASRETARVDADSAATRGEPPPSRVAAARPRDETTRVAARALPAAAPPASTAPIPLNVPPPNERAVSVRFERATAAAGGRHSCAVGADGTVACWGANGDGQLGTGDLQARDEPAPVVTDVRFAQVVTGGSHSCGLTEDGALHCWGDGERGQLGTNARTARPTPARVVGAWRFRGVRLGLAHSCGVATDGSVLCWGANDRGQLGDNGTADRAAPTLVPGFHAAAVSVGWRHSCALTADGVAFCWGENGDGQLGDGTRSARRAPAPVGGGLRFVSIAAGAGHTCAVAADGRAYCWGRNSNGQLGVGSLAPHPLPTPVDTPQRFASVVTGSTHSCARTLGGLVFCWGGNAYGQLGDGTTVGQTRPVRVAGGPYAGLSAAGAHTCASLDGAAVCWGYNVDGQLGDGTRAHRASPMRVTAAAH
jgi:alpha-tubulin suppressor-like RCC1 family protein